MALKSFLRTNIYTGTTGTRARLSAASLYDEISNQLPQEALLFSFPLLFLSPAPLAHILHYD